MMWCVGYSDTLTMSVPLQVLRSLAADFDGKTLPTYIRKSVSECLQIAGTS